MSRSSSPARLFLGFGLVLATAAFAAAVSLYGAQAPAGPTFGPVNAYHVWDGHPAFWDVNLAPAFGAAADFDGDGDRDVLITDGSQPTALRYMRNNGAGAFTATRIEPSGPCPGPNCITNSNRVRAADVNNDGRMDAIIANNHSNNVSVLVNTHLNVFGIPVFTANNYLLFGANAGGRAVNVGDLNNDGKLDLIGGNADWNVYVFLGNGNGTFGPGTIFTDGGNNRLDIAVADLNNDGNKDVIVGNRDGVPGGNISVFLGNGTGALIPSARYAGSNGNSLAVADFNGDGNLDVAANGTATANSVALFAGLGNGLLAAPAFIPTGGVGSVFVSTADFDGDGKRDLAVSNNGGHNVSVLRGNGNGTFGAPTVRPTPLSASLKSPFQVLTADLNGDGKPDLATVNHSSDNLAVMLNTSLPSDTTPPVITPTVTPTPDAGGWSTSNVTVSWGVTDPESPVTSPACAPQTVTTDTAGTPISCSATSLGGTTTKTVTIKRDTTGPSIASVTASPGTLWSPNHKMHAVTVSVDATDAGAGMGVCSISSVGSNEGGNQHEPDVDLTGALTLNLRAERDGNAAGRVYTIQVTCKDAVGNKSTRTATVSVAHDQGKKK